MIKMSSPSSIDDYNTISIEEIALCAPNGTTVRRRGLNWSWLRKEDRVDILFHDGQPCTIIGTKTDCYSHNMDSWALLVRQAVAPHKMRTYFGVRPRVYQLAPPGFRGTYELLAIEEKGGSTAMKAKFFDPCHGQTYMLKIRVPISNLLCELQTASKREIRMGLSSSNNIRPYVQKATLSSLSADKTSHQSLNQDRVNRLSTLPDELLLEIARLCDVPARCALKRVNKRFNGLVHMPITVEIIAWDGKIKPDWKTLALWIYSE